MTSGEQVIQSPKKQIPLQLKGLDDCSYLYSRTFKRPSSTPALYQRCKITQNTILPPSNTSVFVAVFTSISQCWWSASSPSQTLYFIREQGAVGKEILCYVKQKEFSKD